MEKDIDIFKTNKQTKTFSIQVAEACNKTELQLHLCADRDLRRKVTAITPTIKTSPRTYTVGDVKRFRMLKVKEDDTQ